MYRWQLSWWMWTRHETARFRFGSPAVLHAFRPRQTRVSESRTRCSERIRWLMNFLLVLYIRYGTTGSTNVKKDNVSDKLRTCSIKYHAKSRKSILLLLMFQMHCLSSKDAAALVNDNIVSAVVSIILINGFPDEYFGSRWSRHDDTLKGNRVPV